MISLLQMPSNTFSSLITPNILFCFLVPTIHSRFSTLCKIRKNVLQWVGNFDQNKKLSLKFSWQCNHLPPLELGSYASFVTHPTTSLNLGYGFHIKSCRFPL
jgi:hypothetical protein